MSALLERVRVLELTDGLPGAMCGKMMAAAGADVILVEPPETGVGVRWESPFLDDIRGPDRSGVFLYTAGGKRSLTLDPSTPDGREIFTRLLACRYSDLRPRRKDTGGERRKSSARIQPPPRSHHAAQIQSRRTLRKLRRRNGTRARGARRLDDPAWRGGPHAPPEQQPHDDRVRPRRDGRDYRHRRLPERAPDRRGRQPRPVRARGAPVQHALQRDLLFLHRDGNQAPRQELRRMEPDVPGLRRG